MIFAFIFGFVLGLALMRASIDENSNSCDLCEYNIENTYVTVDDMDEPLVKHPTSKN